MAGVKKTYVRKKCEHDKLKQNCRECGGSAFCEHNKFKWSCRECGGSSICEHNKFRQTCRKCGGNGICEHDKFKYACAECQDFACDLCAGAKFSDRKALEKHVAAVHSERGQQRRKKKEEHLARFLDTTGFRYKREQVIRFCGEGNQKFARLDFIIYREYGVCIVELDENQHKHYPIECEAARMMDIFAEQVKVGRLDKIKLIRMNPDAYAENGRAAKTPLKQRYEALREAILQEPAAHFSIKYLFYDQSSPYPEVCLDPAYPRELRELVET